MARQLTFDLPVRAARGREDFFVSPANETALAAIEGWRDWPRGKLVLTGPEGAGKTHLAHVFATLAGAEIIAAGALGDPDQTARGPVALEDADRDLASEEALFHLHNLMAERGHALLLTARTPVRDWPVTLPDLRSRLEAAPSVALAPPDDALLTAVLIKLFADRQLDVSPDLIAWMVPRIERSFAAAAEMVNRLDAAALSKGVPVTRSLAIRLLDTSPGDT